MIIFSVSACAGSASKVLAAIQTAAKIRFIENSSSSPKDGSAIFRKMLHYRNETVHLGNVTTDNPLVQPFKWFIMAGKTGHCVSYVAKIGRLFDEITIDINEPFHIDSKILFCF